jgi:hypothetical protein
VHSVNLSIHKQWAILFNKAPALLRNPFITPLGYKKIGTPLDTFRGRYPQGYLTNGNPFRISLFPSWISLNHLIFAIFLKTQATL